MVSGTLTNAGDYKVTSGNKWLESFENLTMVHPSLKDRTVRFSISWKNGMIGRWDHDFELSTRWVLRNVTIQYMDRNGNVIHSTNPEEFRFHYNISRNGVIKNWKEKKKGFTSILRWSLDNLL